MEMIAWSWSKTTGRPNQENKIKIKGRREV